MEKLINIWTWNVNGIKKKVEFVNQLLIKHKIDILFLTETKITSKNEGMLEFCDGYSCVWNSNKNSYHHGVALVYKSTINIEILSNTLSHQDHPIVIPDSKNKSVMDTTSLMEIIDLAHLSEGRILTAKCNYESETFIIVGTYVPNSGVNRKTPLKRLAYRVLAWDKDLYNHLLELEKKYQKIIWLGDLNVAKCDNDIFRSNINIAGTTPEERSNMQLFIKDNKWIDTWDKLNPTLTKIDERATYGVNIFCKLRLDYLICSSAFEPNIVSSIIDASHQGSDHVPMGTSFLIKNCLSEPTLKQKIKIKLKHKQI